MKLPEPVAWKDSAFGNFHLVNWGGNCEPLYPESAIETLLAERGALKEKRDEFR